MGHEPPDGSAMADDPWVHPVGAGADQETPPAQPGENEAEGLGCRHQAAVISSVHGGMTGGRWKRGEDPHATRVVKGEQPQARRARCPPGDMGEGAAEPAVTVVEDDQRALRGTAQADMLRNRGVTSASMAS